MTVRRRRLLVAIEAVVGVNALGGMAYALGGAKDVPTEWLDGSPFHSYRVPGLVLGAVVGGTSLSAAYLVATEHQAARPAALTSSAVMVGWIASQLAVIGYRSPLQPAVAAVGAAAGWLATS